MSHEGAPIEPPVPDVAPENPPLSVGVAPTEEVQPRESTPEVKVEANADNLEESEKPVAGHFNTDNRNFFQKMSEEGRNVASQVYDKLYETPVVNRLVGKMEIAYNQFWIDRHEAKSIDFKQKAEGLDSRINVFDTSKKELESAIAEFVKSNTPGVDSLRAKLRDVDVEKREMLSKKDKLQSKFEKQNNTMIRFTGERDRVADKLIEHFDRRLEPMEANLENLQTCRDQIDLDVAVLEVRHKDELVRLAGVENRRGDLERAMRNMGMTDKELKKFGALTALEDMISQGRENIRKDKENIARRKGEVNRKVAAMDGKANPYRDKREEFIRIKQNRPIDMKMASRQRGENIDYTVETSSHPRAEAVRDTSNVEEREDVIHPVYEAESVEETNQNFEISRYINGWNLILKNEYGKEASRELVDAKDFMKTTRFHENYKLDSKDFLNILTKYYKLRKMPTDRLNKNISLFEQYIEKIKAENK